MKNMDIDLRHQRTKDAIQGVEDELQNEEGDPQWQDHQDSGEDFCP